MLRSMLPKFSSEPGKKVANPALVVGVKLWNKTEETAGGKE